MDFSKNKMIDVTDMMVDEVQVTELKYALGIPHIFCFEEWEAEQQQKPNKLIPTFAAESEQDKVLQFLEEISDAHKCNSCYTLLCCGSYMFHDANCWFNDLRGTLSLADIRKIYTYKVDVLTGSMLGWEDYAYETFNVEKHCRTPFQAHHFGFYVRCFQCTECSKVDNKKCHAAYHVH